MARVYEALQNALLAGNCLSLDSATASSKEAFCQPCLTVDALGQVALPLSSPVCSQLIESAAVSAADDEHSVFVALAGRFTFRNPAWHSAMDALSALVQERLGIDTETDWRLQERELLVQRAGGQAVSLNFAGPHHREPALGTMLVQLPTMAAAGGTVLAAENEYAWAGPEFEAPCVAAFADVPMTLQPLTSGQRLCVVYSLTCSPKASSAVPSRAKREVCLSELADALHQWAQEQPQTAVAQRCAAHVDAAVLVETRRVYGREVGGPAAVLASAELSALPAGLMQSDTDWISAQEALPAAVGQDALMVNATGDGSDYVDAEASEQVNASNPEQRASEQEGDDADEEEEMEEDDEAGEEDSAEEEEDEDEDKEDAEDSEEEEAVEDDASVPAFAILLDEMPGDKVATPSELISLLSARNKTQLERLFTVQQRHGQHVDVFIVPVDRIVTQFGHPASDNFRTFACQTGYHLAKGTPTACFSFTALSLSSCTAVTPCDAAHLTELCTSVQIVPEQGYRAQVEAADVARDGGDEDACYASDDEVEPDDEICVEHLPREVASRVEDVEIEDFECDCLNDRYGYQRYHEEGCFCGAYEAALEEKRCRRWVTTTGHMLVIAPRGAYRVRPAVAQLQWESAYLLKQRAGNALLSLHDPALQAGSLDHVRALVAQWAAVVRTGGNADVHSCVALLIAALELGRGAPDLVPALVHLIIAKGGVNLWATDKYSQPLVQALSKCWHELSVDAQAALAFMISTCPGVAPTSKVPTALQLASRRAAAVDTMRRLSSASAEEQHELLLFLGTPEGAGQVPALGPAVGRLSADLLKCWPERAKYAQHAMQLAQRVLAAGSNLASAATDCARHVLKAITTMRIRQNECDAAFVDTFDSFVAAAWPTLPDKGLKESLLKMLVELPGNAAVPALRALEDDSISRVCKLADVKASITALTSLQPSEVTALIADITALAGMPLALEQALAALHAAVTYRAAAQPAQQQRYPWHPRKAAPKPPQLKPAQRATFVTAALPQWLTGPQALAAELQHALHNAAAALLDGSSSDASAERAAALVTIFIALRDLARKPGAAKTGAAASLTWLQSTTLVSVARGGSMTRALIAEAMQRAPNRSFTYAFIKQRLTALQAVPKASVQPDYRLTNLHGRGATMPDRARAFVQSSEKSVTFCVESGLFSGLPGARKLANDLNRLPRNTDGVSLVATPGSGIGRNATLVCTKHDHGAAARQKRRDDLQRKIAAAQQQLAAVKRARAAAPGAVAAPDQRQALAPVLPNMLPSSGGQQAGAKRRSGTPRDARAAKAPRTSAMFDLT